MAKNIHVHNMGTNMLRHNFSHNIQLYRLNKRKKHFYNVYTKKSFADNITYHVLTYVNIHPVRGPIHIGNSMFRFHCNTSYINQTKKKKPNNFKIECSLTFYNRTNVPIPNTPAALQTQGKT